MVKAPVDVELLVASDRPNGWAAQELLCARLRNGGLLGTTVRVVVVDSPRAAEQRGLVGSPTILIKRRRSVPRGGPASGASLPGLSPARLARAVYRLPSG
jgi:hypothetical protein